MKALVGTSGYSYKEWKGKFYPEDLPADQMLQFYAQRFGTVEINNTFYRMPSSKLIAQWGEKVPDSFAFVIKASRRITHLGRLKDVGEPVAYLFDTIKELGDKLGAVLFQLPPYMKLDLERLETFLAMLPEATRVAMEFRHISWFDDAVYEALRSRNVAVCIADGELKKGEVPFVSTADWGYLRLRRVNYDEGKLDEWVRKIREQAWEDVFVFFKHEDDAAGPSLAESFIARFDG